MKVVLDANIIIADFNMQSPNFKILLENAKKGRLDVEIPEVVLDEAFNKFKQRIEKSQDIVNSEIQKFNKMCKATIDVPFSDDLISTVIEDYKNRVAKIIADNKITLIAYPKTDHRYLAKKAMLSKKPFNTNEKGYRDCLIWENIKSLISEEDVDIASSPELVFITDNHTDFVSNTDQLHLDLVKELEEEGLKNDSIVIYPSLGEFNEKVAKLFLTQASIFEGRLKNNEFWDFELKSLIDEFLFKEFVGSELSNYYEYAPGANSEPTVSSIDDDYKIDNISVRKLSSDEYIVDVNFDLETELDYFVDKSDYYSSDEVEYSVIDYDWNEYVVHASNSSTISMSVTLIINTNLECQDIQINKIDDEYE